MAEALVLNLLKQLGSTVVSKLVQEGNLIKGVEKEVESLTATLTTILAVLKDADEKHMVKVWLEQLKDVSYDADDVLDEWVTRTLLSKLQTPEENAPIEENVRSILCCFKPVVSSILFSLVCSFKTVVLRHEIGVQIRELNERLDGIFKLIGNCNLTGNRSESLSHLSTSSVADVSDILGRDDDKEILVSNLLGESSYHDSKVPVISIVGMAGFGKTTLAKLILNEKKVIHFFEKHWWVCVSGPFDRERFAKKIIEAATGRTIETVSFDDDWYQLKTSLDSGAVGSRIIITTRNGKIAKLMHSTYIHWLKQLSSDASWLMFTSIAFRGREDDLKIFKDVAKDITHMCKGVPISIKCLASAMQLKNNIQAWRSIQPRDIWNFNEGEVGYYAVPAELKPCLVYCAILPKDSKIIKKEIVELWTAQGYLGCNGSNDLEIEGGQYFEDLAMLSFFEDFEKDSKGNR